MDLLLRRCRFVIALSLLAAAARAETDPAYTALRAARPSGPGIAVQNLVLERDVFRFRFDKGVFQLLPAVDGRVAGAVFIGEGSWQLRPAMEVERRHLALLAGVKDLEVLEDRFDALVLFFTDDTAAEILKGGSPGAAAPERAAATWEAFRRAERKDLRTNLDIRILEDLLGPAGQPGVFLAYLPGTKLPAALAIIDRRELDWFDSSMHAGRETSALWVIPEADAGFWYLCRRRTDLGATEPRPDPPRAEHYEIDSTIRLNSELSGKTTIRFQTAAPGLRVLPIHLTDRLRILEAAVAGGDEDQWTPATFIQEKQGEDSDAAVVLPQAAVPGVTMRLRLRYEGKDVLAKRGDGTFSVGARESWYPNLGTFRNLASFDLTYRVPKGNQVVSVGDRVSSRTEGDLEVSVWRTPNPVRVAGFNYGKFRRIEKDDTDSGLKIEVYTNPGTPDLVREIDAALQSRTSASSSGPPARVDAENYWGTPAGLHSLHVDTSTFADGAMADGLNATRVDSAYFGPLREKRLAITQQEQWFFGQSWPSLIFLPYLAVLDGTQRHELGLGGSATSDFVDLVGPHEIAHQWWGHLVGWNSYRDTWLSEGFAEFAASLVMQRVYGVKRVNDFWERARRRILDKPRAATVSNDQAGPITLGTRLSTRQNEDAYQAIVYEKGAYALHMLHMLMWDPKSHPPDAGFIAMMKDFAASYAGKNPSTRDFQAVVERHMTDVMDLTDDKTMNWFFRQWVDGTEIPRYVVKVDVKSGGAEGYTLSGTVSQLGVSAGFRGFLPLYLEFEKGDVLRLAVVRFTGEETVPIETTLKLPRKPTRVFANAAHDVLSRD